MAYAFRTTLKVSGDVGVHDRLGKAYSPESMRRFHDVVGTYLAGQLRDRLKAQVSSRQLRSPGLRQALAQPATAAGGVYEANESHVVVGSNLPHAAQVHFGGTIRPVRGKALAIPLTDQLKRSGRWPSDFGRDELAFVPSEESSGVVGFLFAKTAKGRRRGKPLFMLVTKVTQRARPYAYIDGNDVDRIKQLWSEHLDAEGR